MRVRNGGVDFFKLDLFVLLPCGGERNQKGVRLACPWVDGWSRGVACMIRASGAAVVAVAFQADVSEGACAPL